MSSRIVVVGATGALGTLVCRGLAAEGHEVAGLVRETSQPAARRALSKIGVEACPGDLKDPSTLRAALAGAEAVVTTASATLPDHRRAGDTIEAVDRDGTIALIDACEAGDVERIVYVSSSSRDDGPATRAKRAVEERLARGSLAYTILQPCRYMEVWLSPALGFDVENARARVFGTGIAPVSWVAREDVAKIACSLVRRPPGERSTLVVGGPEALSQREVVSIFERVTGRRFTLEVVTTGELEHQRRSARDPLQESYAAFMLDTAAGNVVDTTDLADDHRPPTTVRRYAERVATPG
jgi:uncharacterized protein YbjT (DUF2867 family)